MNFQSVKKAWIRHLVFWSVLTVYLCLLDPVEGTLPMQAIGTFLIIVRYAFIYYTEYLIIFPRFYRKKLVLFTCLIFTFLIYYSLSYFTFVIFLGYYSPIHMSYAIKILLISNIVLFSIITIMALGTYQKKMAVKQLLKQSEREKALLFKELGFLRNQFNSQMTFNFLKYCYDKIYKESKQTAEALEVFIRMLRYSLSNKLNEKVLLKNEITYIEDFVLLQKLLNSKINVKLIITGEIYDNIQILPRILIVFVENAFKHGNPHSLKNPIVIELNYLKGILMFKVTNEKARNPIKEISGIGHYNLKEHLELFYRNNYDLEVNEEKEIYHSNLNICIESE